MADVAFVSRWAIRSALLLFRFSSEKRSPPNWVSLRTTNIIERLNKEFKRCIKPMEIAAGETACYRLLAFIYLKMEMHGRSNLGRKVRANLLFYRNFALIS